VRALAEHRTAAAAILRRDARLFLSYRFRFLGQLLSALLSLTLFYYVSRLVALEPFAGPDDYFAFVVLGLVTLRLLTATLAQPPQALLGELLAGTFERLAVSPAGPVVTVLATLVFPFLQAVVLGLLMLVFAGVVYGIDLEWSTLALAVPLAALAGLAFAPLAVLIVALVLVVKQATSTTGFVVAGVSLVSGLYFPVALLPGWLRWLSEVQPFTPAVDLMRHVVLGRALEDPAWLDLLRLAGFAAVLLPVSVLVLRAAIGLTRRRGTLSEV
jgi:ABC-2 type transport system permease protein